MGPKPTKLQMETLKKLAEPNVVIHWWMGIRGPSAARIQWPSPDPEKTMGKSENLRTDTLDKFRTWGWVKDIGEKEWSWRNNTYVLTDEGREVIAKGEIRK